MFNKERLLSISELDEAKTKQMNDSQLKAFTAVANSLEENLPTMAENAKTAMKAKDIEELAKLLTEICDMLQQLYAERLANECLNKIKTMSSAQYEDIQAYVIDFLKNVSALSIDLQMAEFKDTPAPPVVSIDGTATKNTILAVDDRHFFLQSIKNMLQDTGYKVTCVNSGEAALNYLKNHRSDLFLLDIDMPTMDGYELAQKIRKLGQPAPIIFLTGNSQKKSVVRALQAGGNDFIVKPVTKDQLLERIGRYIQPDTTED